MSPKVLQLDPRDNVLVALANLGNGEFVSNAGESFRLSSDVPAKHKFVTHEIAAGGEIIMYGVLVGRASKAIHQGELLTTSNVRHAAAAFHNKTETYDWSAPDVSRWRQREFLGYHRCDGQVGTRNYWLVVPLVFCENRNLQVPVLTEYERNNQPIIARANLAIATVITEEFALAPAGNVWSGPIVGLRFVVERSRCMTDIARRQQLSLVNCL